MDFLSSFISEESNEKSFISQAFEISIDFQHVESVSKIRLFESLFSLIENLIDDLEEELLQSNQENFD